MEKIKVTMTWNGGRAAGLWWNDKPVWEPKEVFPDTDFLTTELYLPVREALQFCLIFVNGTTARLVAALLIKMNEKVAEWKILQEQTKRQEQSLEWEDW